MREEPARRLFWMLTVFCSSWPAVALGNTFTTTYDQRQDGSFNLHAQLENVVLVLLPAASWSQLLTKGTTHVGHSVQGSYKHLNTMANLPAFQVSGLDDGSDKVVTVGPNAKEDTTLSPDGIITPNTKTTASTKTDNELNVDPLNTMVIKDSETTRDLSAQSPMIALLQQRRLHPSLVTQMNSQESSHHLT